MAQIFQPGDIVYVYEIDGVPNDNFFIPREGTIVEVPQDVLKNYTYPALIRYIVCVPGLINSKGNNYINKHWYVRQCQIVGGLDNA